MTIFNDFINTEKLYDFPYPSPNADRLKHKDKNHNTVAVSGHPNPTHSPGVPGGMGGLETHKGEGYKKVQETHRGET